MMPRFLRPASFLVAVFLLGSTMRAQYPPDWWLVNMPQLCDFWPFAGDFSVSLPPAPGGRAYLAVDDGKTVYAATGAYSFAYDVTAPNYIPVMNWSVYGYSHGSQLLTRDGWWTSIDFFGLVTRRRRSDGSNGAQLGDLCSVLGLPAFPASAFGGACTNGRETFFTAVANWQQPNQPAILYAADLTTWPPTYRVITTLPSIPAGGTSRPSQLYFGPDGRLLSFLPDRFVLIDPMTGATQYDNTSQLPPGMTGSCFGYNVWDGTAVMPLNYDEVWRWSGTHWHVAFAFIAFQVGCMVSTSPVPFLLFGRGCVNGLNAEPRLGWRGLPRQGQSFEINLRNAEPNGVSLFWLGVSDTLDPGFGALPVNAAPFGAPDCYVRVSNQAAWFALVDAAGRSSVSIPVPVNPALAGFECFVQSASSSTGNALGFAASDAVAVRIR